MTVQSSVSRNDYTGNNSTNTYPYTYRIRDESHLRLIVTDPDGVETVLVITTDYTVTGVNANGGGNIVLVDAGQAWLTSGNLSSGYDLAIIRKRAIIQETDLRNQGAYFPEAVEDELDNSREIDQQQQEEIDRCVKLPEGGAGDDSTLPDLVAGEYIRVNAAGTGFELGTPSQTTSDYNGNIDVGLYAARNSSPSTNDLYFPTDKPGMVCICYSSGTWTDFKMRYSGLDSAKAASPKAGDAFQATDTKKVYFCFVDGTWTTLTNGTKGSDIASATTCDIGAATGEFVDITGTTTITGFGTIGAGAIRKVRFTGVLTLTHNGTSLILPGATNITTAANDTAEFVSLGSGNWLCLSYKRASGLSVVAPGFQTAASQTEMEAGAATDKVVTPANFNWHPGAAKAWGRFDGTGTPAFAVRYNFDASITDNGTGDYTLGITTDFSSGDYVGAGMAKGGAAGSDPCIVNIEGNPAAGTINVEVCVAQTGSRADSAIVTVVLFGDQ